MTDRALAPETVRRICDPISIDFETTADGKTVVQAWMSHWQSRVGMVDSGGWGMAKKIIRKIDQATA